jgi:hypothetical protein
VRLLLVVALLACGNRAPHGPGGAGGSAGSGTGSAGGSASVATGTACDAVRDRIAGLYRSQLRDRDPARIDEAVADNTTMVLNDCVKAPERAVACITAASTAAELEARCLEPLDDEGTEGDQLAR